MAHAQKNIFFLSIPCCWDVCNTFYVHVSTSVGTIVKYGLCWWRWITSWGWGELSYFCLFVYVWLPILWFMMCLPSTRFCRKKDLFQTGSRYDFSHSLLILEVLTGKFQCFITLMAFLMNSRAIYNYWCHLHYYFAWIYALQDLKPRFHSSRLHGSDNAEDDVRCFTIFLIFCLWVPVNR